jgi:hypothetical protein
LTPQGGHSGAEPATADHPISCLYLDIQYITVVVDFFDLFHVDIEYIAVAVSFETRFIEP